MVTAAQLWPPLRQQLGSRDYEHRRLVATEVFLSCTIGSAYEDEFWRLFGYERCHCPVRQNRSDNRTRVENVPFPLLLPTPEPVAKGALKTQQNYTIRQAFWQRVLMLLRIRLNAIELQEARGVMSKIEELTGPQGVHRDTKEVQHPFQPVALRLDRRRRRWRWRDQGFGRSGT